MMNAALGHPMSTATYEGPCAGNTQTQVTGIAVCYAPTIEILHRAVAEKRNLIISREHPFYLHGGLNYAYTTGGLEAALMDDAVVKAKRAFINANKMMVYRYGAAWDNFRPHAQSAALARALGLTPHLREPVNRERGVMCDVPRTTLAALARTASAKIHANSCRTIGDPSTSVTRVAVLAGETDPKEALSQLLADRSTDGLIAGGGGVVDEVDGAISWFQDLMATGRRIAALIVGYGPSQDPGCEDLARFVKTVFPDLPVDWWPVHDPSWIP
jgi:putative NIF3 family GTP cyclohydrolase 1 type 2